MAKGKYKVYYTEAELDVDIDNGNFHYDELQVFIGECKVSLEMTANCRKLATAAKRFSEGYKAAVADGIIPATLVKAFESYHLETLVEDARENGEPLEYTFYGVAKYPDGTVASVFEAEDFEDSYYIHLTLPYEINEIEKDFPTVYVGCSTETPDYSDNEALLKGSCEAAVKVAKANIKNIREEISELKADFDKKQVVADELTAKKERGEYYYEPDLSRAVGLAKCASDKIAEKKAELDEFKVVLKKAEATLAEIGKTEAEDTDTTATAEDSAIETKETEEMATTENEQATAIEYDFNLGNEETETTEPAPAETAEPTEPQVYFYISGTIYGHYDSEETRELLNYLWGVNKSGKCHNKIRIEHFEGTDVEEYCDSDDCNVSEYETAEYITGTVTPWTLHQIQAYDGEGGIKVDVKAEMRFAC